MELLHPCQLIYKIGGENFVYGNTPGTCKITGKESIGLPFANWVKNTFNDHSFLQPGDIISNEALFCFDEKSVIIQKKTNKDKLQRFRTYSHIVINNEWYCVTKADKRQIFDHIVQGAELVCLTDTGQKHLLFKHRLGMWQLDDIFLIPDIPSFCFLHSSMCQLLALGFSQTEVITGKYPTYKLLKINVSEWKELENSIKTHRGSSLFTFVSWLLFTTP